MLLIAVTGARGFDLFGDGLATLEVGVRSVGNIKSELAWLLWVMPWLLLVIS